MVVLSSIVSARLPSTSVLAKRLVGDQTKCRFRTHQQRSQQQRFRSTVGDQGFAINPNNICLAAIVAAGGAYYFHKCSKCDAVHSRKKICVDTTAYRASPPEHTGSDGDFELCPIPYEGAQTIRIDDGLSDVVGAHQLNANKIIEDRVVAAQIKMSDGKKCFFGAVIDGHGGPHVADYVQRNLPRYLQHFVDKNKLESKDTKKLAKLLPEVYLALDNDICQIIRSRTDMLYSRTAKIGACCLSVVITPTTAIIANAGDCEGIVGYAKKRRGQSYVPLADPHSANLPSEQERLRREHPGESDIVRCKRNQTIPRVPRKLHEYILHGLGVLGTETVPDICYVKGRLQPTRCFGDFHLKSEEFAFDHETNRPLVNPPYSFPYITAMPEVFTINLRRGVLGGRRAKFVTLACDGVYDFLDHDQVEEAVRESLDHHDKPKDVAKKLVERTMIEASRDNEITLNELLNLSPDIKRRHHDDTSVLHFDLEALSKKH